jgi:myo-inositol-1-phosphate synthase
MIINYLMIASAVCSSKVCSVIHTNSCDWIELIGLCYYRYYYNYFMEVENRVEFIVEVEDQVCNA